MVCKVLQPKTAKSHFWAYEPAVRSTHPHTHTVLGMAGGRRWGQTFWDGPLKIGQGTNKTVGLRGPD